MQDKQERDFRAQKIYEFKLDVKKYIESCGFSFHRREYLDKQSPIKGHSHPALIELCNRYGRENVKREFANQLAEATK
jgi:hypothetical protein